MPGYPIRTPWDPRSVDNSPRPIAASHVLHRLLVPRHPPFALTNLTTKMLASTVQFSNNTPPTTHTHHLHHPQPHPRRSHTQHGLVEDGTGQKQQPGPGNQDHSPGTRGPRLFFQDPTGCLYHHTTPTSRSVPHHHPRLPRGQGSTRNPAAHRRCDLPVSPPHEPPR
jgi:hypothetical protein